MRCGTGAGMLMTRTVMVEYMASDLLMFTGFEDGLSDCSHRRGTSASP